MYKTIPQHGHIIRDALYRVIPMRCAFREWNVIFLLTSWEKVHIKWESVGWREPLYQNHYE